MTGEQVIQAIKLALDKYSASTSAVIGPAFLDEELCAFANQAMLETICTKFTGNNQLQQGFESSVKRISDFSKLIVNKTHQLSKSISNIFTTGNITDSNNCLFIVSIKIMSKTGNSCIPVELIDRVSATKFLKTPTNYPWIPTPKAVIGGFTNDTGNFTINVYTDPDFDEGDGAMLFVEYVMQPSLLTEDNLTDDVFDNAFSDNILYEIINKAALFALDNTESQRVAVKSELNKIQE